MTDANGETAVGHTDTIARRPLGARGGWLGRRPWLTWTTAAVVLPALVAGVSTAVSGRSIERDLADRAREALQESGLRGSVDSHGRDLIVRDVPADRRDEVRAAVLGVVGVRSAEVLTIERDDAPAPLPVAAVETLMFAISDREVAVAGTVPSDAVRRELLATIRQACGERRVTGGLSVVPGAAVPWQVAPLSRLLTVLGNSRGAQSLSWDAGGVTVRGMVPTALAQSSLQRALRSAAPGVSLRSEVTVSAGPAAASADLWALRAQLDRLFLDHPVEFAADSAVVPPEAKNLLRRLAQFLLMAKDRWVVVAGHDIEGPNDDPAARDLLIHRVRAVRDQLIALGVPARRIDTSGLGDTGPSAHSNAEGGKAGSRRVELTIH